MPKNVDFWLDFSSGAGKKKPGLNGLPLVHTCPKPSENHLVQLRRLATQDRQECRYPDDGENQPRGEKKKDRQGRRRSSRLHLSPGSSVAGYRFFHQR